MKKLWHSLIVFALVAMPLSISPAPIQSAGTGFVLRIEQKTTYAQQQVSPSARESGGSTSSCDTTDIGCHIAYFMATAMIGLGGFFVYLAGLLLNYAIIYTIVEMSTNLGAMEALQIGWSTFRDLANIFFIFVLLWIGVSTILNLRSRATMQALVRIIIVALLLNFSLFFTKVAIDASNIVSIQFYNAIVDQKAPEYDPLENGIAWAYMRMLGINTFFPNGNVGADSAPNSANYEEILTNEHSYFMVGIMGFIFMLITAFAFLAAAILLIIRFAILVFLMITAPLAYVGFILPSGGGYAGKWWSSLVDQCIFAPVMMMFFWFTAVVVNSDSFQGILNGAQAGDVANASIANAINSGASSSVGIIFNFLIVITFMLASIIVAKKAGASGSGFATNWAGKLSFGMAGALGRTTIGRAAARGAERLKDTNFATTRLGRTTLQSVRGVAGSSFDLRSSSLGSVAKGAGADLGSAGGKGGFVAEEKKKVEEMEKYGKSLGKTKLFSSPETQQRVEDLTERNKGDEAEVANLDRQIRQMENASDKSPADLIAIQKLKDNRETIQKSVQSRKTELTSIDTNPNLTMTKSAAYAATIAGEGRFGKPPSTSTRVGTAISWITFNRKADKEAAKKIRDGMKEKKPEQKLKDVVKEMFKAEEGHSEKKPEKTESHGEAKKEEHGGGGAGPKKEDHGGGGGSHGGGGHH